MVRRKGDWVFLCHKYETGDNKHEVSWGDPKKKLKYSSKRFNRMPDARKFAAKKARSLGLKTYLADLPKGARDVKVSKKPRKKSTKRRKRDPFSLF